MRRWCLACLSHLRVLKETPPAQGGIEILGTARRQCCKLHFTSEGSHRRSRTCVKKHTESETQVSLMNCKARPVPALRAEGHKHRNKLLVYELAPHAPRTRVPWPSAFDRQAPAQSPFGTRALHTASRYKGSYSAKHVPGPHAKRQQTCMDIVVSTLLMEIYS